MFLVIKILNTSLIEHSLELSLMTGHLEVSRVNSIKYFSPYNWRHEAIGKP
jgi:hypothetical protein